MFNQSDSNNLFAGSRDISSNDIGMNGNDNQNQIRIGNHIQDSTVAAVSQTRTATVGSQVVPH